MEHDTGSEQLSRVADKLAGYRDLAEAEGNARPVLFWLAQPGREPGLRHALGDTALPVATAVVGMGNPADAIWLLVGEEARRRPLVQLSALAAEANR